MAYILFRVLFLVVAPAFAVWLMRPLGIRARDVLVLFAVGIPAGVLGAHLLAVAEPGATPDVLGVWNGQSAIFGGYAAAIVVAVGYAVWRRIPIPRLLDGSAPVMALGEGMTRIGCFFAGCCWGAPTTSIFGVTFPHRSPVFVAQARAGLVPFSALRSLPVHPTQIYAAIFGFALCALLVYLLRRRRAFDGMVFCVFVVSYGLWRFFLAYLRGDGGPPLALGLVSSQVWSLVAVATAAVLALAWRRRAARVQPASI